jgi:hypothetical protein
MAVEMLEIANTTAKTGIVGAKIAKTMASAMKTTEKMEDQTKFLNLAKKFIFILVSRL